MIRNYVRQHLDEHFKIQIAGKRQKNMAYKWAFEFLKTEMLKTSTSFVKSIGQRFVIKGKLYNKGRSSSGAIITNVPV